MPPFEITVLSPDHDKTTFFCNVEPLDRYLHERASQDMRRKVTTCFVAVDSVNQHIAGYYTLSAGAVFFSDLPEAYKKRLPRYPSMPVARLGRLAVGVNYRNQQLGAALLYDALERASNAVLAAFALVVDAKDETAQRFYEHHGFIVFDSLQRQLIYPFPTKAKK